MKDIRVVGIDDSHFKPHTEGKVTLIGVVMRSSKYIDGFLKGEIEIDGMDSTDVIIKMVRGKYEKDIRVIMTQGITFGGFNVLDVERLYKETGKSVIVISRKMPDLESMERALREHFLDWEERVKLINEVNIEKLKNGEFEIYVQRVGIDKENTKEIIRKFTIRGAIPEPVRVAHLAASALHFGESRGKP